MGNSRGQASPLFHRPPTVVIHTSGLTRNLDGREMVHKSSSLMGPGQLCWASTAALDRTSAQNQLHRSGNTRSAGIKGQVIAAPIAPGVAGVIIVVVSAPPVHLDDAPFHVV